MLQASFNTQNLIFCNPPEQQLNSAMSDKANEITDQSIKSRQRAIDQFAFVDYAKTIPNPRRIRISNSKTNRWIETDMCRDALYSKTRKFAKRTDSNALEGRTRQITNYIRVNQNSQPLKMVRLRNTYIY